MYVNSLSIMRSQFNKKLYTLGEVLESIDFDCYGRVKVCIQPYVIVYRPGPLMS